MKENIEFLRIMAEGYMEGESLERVRASLEELHRAVDALSEARRVKEEALGDSDVLRKATGLFGALDALGMAEEHNRRAGDLLEDAE